MHGPAPGLECICGIAVMRAADSIRGTTNMLNLLMNLRAPSRIGTGVFIAEKEINARLTAQGGRHVEEQ